MIRAVVDTNIIVSALFWGGLPRIVLEAGLNNDYLILVTEPLIGELERVLLYPKFTQQLTKHNLTFQSVVNNYRASAVLVESTEVPVDVVRDPKDRAVLECTVGGNADFIVSGDKDLLVLVAYQNIVILTAEQFVQHMAKP